MVPARVGIASLISSLCVILTGFSSITSYLLMLVMIIGKFCAVVKSVLNNGLSHSVFQAVLPNLHAKEARPIPSHKIISSHVIRAQIQRETTPCFGRYSHSFCSRPSTFLARE